VDTSLLLAGVLFCHSYFDRQNPRESEIRRLGGEIYRRVDWPWAQPRPPAIALAWTPSTGSPPLTGTVTTRQCSYILLALGSPRHPIGPAAVDVLDQHLRKALGNTLRTRRTSASRRCSGISTPTSGWIFAHSRRVHARARTGLLREQSPSDLHASAATPSPIRSTGARTARNIWGLSASDGPGPPASRTVGRRRPFSRMRRAGVGVARIVDDGTIAPTAAISSLPFAPEIVMRQRSRLYQRFGSSIYSSYGFLERLTRALRYRPTLPRVEGRRLG